MSANQSFPLTLLASSITGALLAVSSFSATAQEQQLSEVEVSSFNAPELKHSQTNFGGVGLMQMPTARMAPEGEFNLSASFNNEYYFYNVSLQVMPWLETTIRYTQVQDLLYTGNGSADCLSKQFLVVVLSTLIKASTLKFA